MGLFRLTVNRGTHFVNMGHTLQGQTYLYPEEALYLVDRGSLLAEHLGVDMTVQEMWNVYLSRAHTTYNSQEEKNPDVDIAHKQGSSLAMDRYLAYAYLKRLGFVVTRPGTYTDDTSTVAPQYYSTAHSSAIVSASDGALSWTLMWQSVFGAWRNNWSTLAGGVGLFLDFFASRWSRRYSQPLVANTAQMNYDQILQNLQIIPSMRLTTHPSVEDGYGDGYEKGSRTKRKVDFEVYKPAGTFKKRQPGSPDYRVVVVSSSAALPNLGELSDYMGGQADPVSECWTSTPVSAAPDKGKRPKTPEWPKALFAVVEGGQVSFINMFNLKAIP
ncbi:tRNA-splicing endonuclease subunit sen54 [Mortierella sp. GBA30]|nr:tRNA-splicing endonuclease subunit sen54 [Mortierella sp. GBA30]